MPGLEFRFSFAGDPRGKQQNRVGLRGGKVMMYAPKEATDFASAIRAQVPAAMAANPEWVKPPKGHPVQVFIHTYRPFPKATSLRVRSWSPIPQPTKPDLDNSLKQVLDALCSDRKWTSPILDHDAQITELYGRKSYAECDAAYSEVTFFQTDPWWYWEVRGK